MVIINITPPTDHPALSQFTDQICRRSQLTVVPAGDPLFPHEYCYWNVERKVKTSRGSMLTGWLIQYWPGVFMVAQHHAVWRGPDGKLFDITTKIETDSVKDHSLFLPDKRIRVDLDTVPNIRSRHLPLSKDVRVAEAIRIYREQHALTGELLDLNRTVDPTNISCRRASLGLPKLPLEFSGQSVEKYLILLKERNRLANLNFILWHDLIKTPPC